MPLDRGHLDDGRRQQTTGAGEVRTGWNCTLSRFQTDYGGPDTMPLMAAQSINDYLPVMKACVPVVDLHLAFEPGARTGQNRSLRLETF